MFPWWTFEGVKLAFFRPVTVLTHRLDHALWPDKPALMHAHSLLWLGAMVAAAAVAYRRILGHGLAAGLAALAYAIDDGHAFPAAWVANRNAMVATTFGLLALIAHDRWRRDRWVPGAALGPALLALGLCSAEAAIAAFALLLAHATFLDAATPARRAIAILPHLAVVVVWRLVHGALGYGAYGSGYYVDPLASPVAFARAVAERAPVLLLGQWALAPTDVHVFLPETARTVLWIVGACVVALLAWLLGGLVRRDRVARFFAASMLLCVVPACATFPMERLLLFAGFGAMGLFAMLLAHLPVRPAARRLAVGLAVVHLAVAPILLPIRTLSPLLFAPIARNLASVPDDPNFHELDIVAVRAPDPYSTGFIPLRRALDGRALPAHVRRLASSGTALTVRRLDARTLHLRPEGGFLSEPDAMLVRDREHPMRRGDRVVLTGLTIEIVASTPDHRPAEVTFRFDRPLEDPGIRWLAMGADGFVPWTPPQVGRTVRLPAHPLL